GGADPEAGGHRRGPVARSELRALRRGGDPRLADRDAGAGDPRFAGGVRPGPAGRRHRLRRGEGAGAGAGAPPADPPGAALDAERRAGDLYVREPRRVEEVLRFEPPAGYSLDEPPARSKVVGPALGVACDYALDGGAIEVRRTLEWHPGRFPKDGYAWSRRAVQAFARFRQRAVTLKKDPPAAA